MVAKNFKKNSKDITYINCYFCHKIGYHTNKCQETSIKTSFSYDKLYIICFTRYGDSSNY